MSTIRSLAATIASNRHWSALNADERRRHTEPARAAWLLQFEQAVDLRTPGLDPIERARRAEFLYRTYMARLALAREQARRERKRPTPKPMNPKVKTLAVELFPNEP